MTTGVCVTRAGAAGSSTTCTPSPLGCSGLGNQTVVVTAVGGAGYARCTGCASIGCTYASCNLLGAACAATARIPSGYVGLLECGVDPVLAPVAVAVCVITVDGR